MKTKLLSLSLATLASAAPFAQSQPQQKPSAPKLTAEQQATMEAMQKAGAIGPQHKQLQAMVGDWTYAMKFWTDPAGKPDESTGSTTYRSLMDGRFVQHEHKGVSMGMPFHGLGVLGYDNVTKQFQAHFFENMSTGQMLLNGGYDPASKTYTFRGDMDDMLKPGTKVKVRETVKVVDNDTHVLEWYETRSGKEARTLEITYKRKK
jgi:hypothetical protein